MRLYSICKQVFLEHCLTVKNSLVLIKCTKYEKLSQSLTQRQIKNNKGLPGGYLTQKSQPTFL